MSEILDYFEKAVNEGGFDCADDIYGIPGVEFVENEYLESRRWAEIGTHFIE